MGGCAAINCTNHSRKKSRMFRFPADETRRRKWTINCRRHGWVPGPRAELCSDHFEESQFEQHRADGLKKLKPNAVPTLFKVPNPPAAFSSNCIKGKGFPKLGSTLDCVPVNTAKMRGGCRCSVFSCRSQSTTAKASGQPLMFFSFPKDPQIRKQWVQKCYRNDEWNPNTARICSRHFTNEDYEDALMAELLNIKPRKLKKTAVPSLHLLSEGDDEESSKPRSCIERERQEVVGSFSLLKSALEREKQQGSLDNNSNEYAMSGHDSQPDDSLYSATDNGDPPLETVIKKEIILPDDYEFTTNPSDTTSTATASTSATVIPLEGISKKPKLDLTISDVRSTSELEHFNKTHESTKTEDRFDIFGKNVTCKLREMDKTQRILVEKIINDALFEGEMGTLTRNHRLVDVSHLNSRPEVQYNAFLPYTAVRCIPVNSAAPSYQQPQGLHDESIATERQTSLILP